MQKTEDSVSFKKQTGVLGFAGTAFKKGRIVFVFNEFTVSSEELVWKNCPAGYGADCRGCVFYVLLRGNTFSLAIQNKSADDLFLKEILVLFPPVLKTSDYLEYIHTFNTASGSGVKKVGLETRWQTHNPESSMVYLLKNRLSGNSILVSTLPPHAGDYVVIKARHDAPHLEGNFGLEIKSIQQRLVKKGAQAQTSLLQYMTSANPLELLARLGEQWSVVSKKPLKNTVIGWNSWDYYAGAVSSRDMYENQQSAKKLFGNKVKYFVIDEGYEHRWGVWEANRKFPEGLKKFCRNIKSKGGIPGVWTAPLLVNAYTPLYRAHPEWFGKRGDGQIVQTLMSYGPMAYLDITRPDVEQFVFNIFKTLKKYGFRYFKIDFMQEMLKCELFEDKTVPRGMLIRKTFQIIRRAIGKNSYLLAAGAPFESVTGIVDAVRVTDDIHNYWSHIVGNARTIAARWWMHRKLWNIDPDFFIVRCDETSPDKQLNRDWGERPFQYRNVWLNGRPMNYEEAKVYSLLIYLSGGDIFLGDNLSKLNRKGAELIRKVIEQPLSRPAMPLDMFDGHDKIPSIWLAEEKDYRVIALINWEEDIKDFTVDLEKYGITDYRRMEPLFSAANEKIQDGIIRVSLRPRSCAAWKIYK
jgi:hypothetical protein